MMIMITLLRIGYVWFLSGSVCSICKHFGVVLSRLISKV